MVFPSDVRAGGAQFLDHGFEAARLNGAQAAGRELQRHPPAFALQPETLRVQVRQEAAALLDVRVGDLVSGPGAFSRDLADSRHGSGSKNEPRIRPVCEWAVKSACWGSNQAFFRERSALAV